MAKEDRTHKFSEKQRANSEVQHQAFRESIYEAMKKYSSSLGTITSTNVNPKYTKLTSTGGSISLGGMSAPTKTNWTFNWEPMTSDGTGYNPHEECTPTRDYNDVREALIALLLRDHDGVIEFPQEMVDEIQNWKVVVDNNERSLRIVAIPPEVHVGERENDDVEVPF